MQICLLEQSGNPVINGVEAKRRSRCRGPAYGGVNLYPVELKNIPLGLSKEILEAYD